MRPRPAAPSSVIAAMTVISAAAAATGGAGLILRCPPEPGPR
jgi:hypothetical protein